MLSDLPHGTVLYKAAFQGSTLLGTEKFTIEHRGTHKGIYTSENKLFAQYFTGTGFVTLSEKLKSGKWIPQNKVTWEAGPAASERLVPKGWLQMKLEPTDTCLVLQQAIQFAHDLADRAVEHGEILLFSFPDTTIGYRVEVPTFCPDGATTYAFLLTLQEFMEVFKGKELSKCFKGQHHQTFFY